jgi:hypothetical protein
VSETVTDTLSVTPNDHERTAAMWAAANAEGFDGARAVTCSTGPMPAGLECSLRAAAGPGSSRWRSEAGRVGAELRSFSAEMLRVTV